eukprot:6528318-Pyramimonas_sp.AAC.1
MCALEKRACSVCMYRLRSTPGTAGTVVATSPKYAHRKPEMRGSAIAACTCQGVKTRTVSPCQATLPPENSICPPIVCGRHMYASSPKPKAPMPQRSLGPKSP